MLHRLFLRHGAANVFIRWRRRKGKYHGIASTRQGNKTIDLYFELEMHEDIRQRAETLGVSTAKYIKLILGQWLESGMKLKLEEG
jgi:hypothetical protein